MSQTPGIVYTAPKSLSATGPAVAASSPAPAASPSIKPAPANISSLVPPAASALPAPVIVGGSAASSPKPTVPASATPTPATSATATPARSNLPPSPVATPASSSTPSPRATGSSETFSEARLLSPAPAAASPSLAAEQEAASLPKVTVQRRADGSRVIRSQVPSSVAQAEAAVANELPVPSIRPTSAKAFADFSQAPAGQQLSAVASGLAGDVKPLPKWVTSSLDRTSGKNQIVVLPGVTEIVRIARGFPNRFTTPFDTAEVITTDENLTHDGVGGSVIVATASDKPIGIFIQDKNSDRAIALVLIPEDIPQRDIRLVLDDSWGPPQLRNVPDQAGSSVPSGQSDFVEYIKSIMRALALGDIPEGHALSPLQPDTVPACQIPGLVMRLGQMLEGSKSRIAVYTAVNQTQASIPVQEAGCYRSGVLAVSAYPRPVLEPGQDTEVYVVLRKDSFASRATGGKRRPVLVTQ